MLTKNLNFNINILFKGEFCYFQTSQQCVVPVPGHIQGVCGDSSQNNSGVDWDLQVVLRMNTAHNSAHSVSRGVRPYQPHATLVGGLIFHVRTLGYDFF